MNNINNIGKDPKQRNILMVVGAIIILAVVIGLWFAGRGSKSPQAQSGANIATVPSVAVAVGTSDSPEYNKQVKGANATGAQAALNKNTSFVATPTNGSGLTDHSVLDLIEKENQKIKAEAKAKEDADLVIKEQKAAQVQTVKVVTTTTQAVQTPIYTQAPPHPADKYTAEDASVISSLMSARKIKSPSSEYDFARSTNTAKANSDSSSSSQASQQVATQVQNPPLAKAGTVFNAILETGINSDEPSPVLARIVSGELKGTRLIGQIGQVGGKVIVQFTTANIPNMPNSIRINAVAVDANTSRTALASDVDNHYLKKYGVMFAAAFLGGYADAISHNNATTIIPPTGGATIVQGQLSSSEINKQALGSVGKALANQTQKETDNLKPTITVDTGIAMGVLLMDDLTIRQ